MSKKRVQQQITPKQLFDEKGLLGLDLAEEFAKSRWKVEDGAVKLRTEKGTVPFGRNAGAIEIITEDNRQFRSHGFSQPALFQNPKAHTERIMMRDALEDVMPPALERLMPSALEWLIPEDFAEGGIRKPSQMARIPENPKEKKQPERLILKAVTDNASTYKNYLDSTGSVVKMFSERIPCGGKEGCNQFLDNILPETDGTAVGYFTEKTLEAGTREVKTFANHMVKAYQDYININTDWPKADNLGNTSSYSYSESSSEEIFRRRRLHHHNTASSTDS